ncbi:MAG: hypothetical protein C5S48_00020 [Candidatus Methanogaster sp.]|nr:MAG: hypothetical protein C5S48_00020 [ANME-2 cluster archaeon]
MTTIDSHIRVCVVCEAKADAMIVQDLSDRVLLESERVSWIDSQEMVQYCREWTDYEYGIPYIIWRKIDGYINNLSVVKPHRHGFFGDKPAEPYAITAWKALSIIKTLDSPPESVFLIVDADDQVERKIGLNQARNSDGWPFRIIVVGLAITKRECWVLAGFDPQDDDERNRLQTMRSELGFSPTRDSHRLGAKHEKDKKNAKRVLSQLTNDDHSRQKLCWRETPLSTLRENGSQNGLADFLDELEERYVPLFTDHRTTS